MNYRQFGSGPAIICLPGTTGNHKIFEPLIDKIRSKYKVIACDHPKLTLQQYLNTINDLIIDHNVSAILGTSVGGYITQLYLNNYDHNLKAAVLSNTYNDPRPIQNSSKFAYTVSKYSPWTFIKWILKRQISKENSMYPNHSELEQIVKKEIDGLSKHEFIQRLDWTMQSDKICEDIEIPILQIISEDDPIIAEQQINSVNVAHNQVFQYKLVSGSHFPYFFYSEKIGDQILGFLVEKLNIS